MFTGIVTGQGTVLDLVPDHTAGVTRLVIDTHGLAADLETGGSLAVNGACLTALADTGQTSATGRADVFRADLMEETLVRTTLGALRPGDVVNLERCLPAGARLDGHVVQGHVDATGAVAEIAPQGAWTRLRVSMPARIEDQVAEKGAVAVDGVSLTVTAVSPAGAQQPWFEVGLVPATLEATRLGGLQSGDRVNIETDVLAKYLQRMLQVQGVQR
ncbi:riboflavin synthase [Actinomyces sp. 2119]|uniref:riboflavin synthase n=1 Tax=Actinomyces sp. 2119 TaxID=2321393 RepID=UPI000E6D3493|nr:riboflavin synthase [Actinomyces sp. 2119]RJF40916.1 riboflavin synthase [Actinomyces sp. 2119]